MTEDVSAWISACEKHGKVVAEKLRHGELPTLSEVGGLYQLLLGGIVRVKGYEAERKGVAK